MIITKKQVLEYLDKYYDDDDEVDLDEVYNAIYERHARLVERLEEEQHETGFYSFQDKLYNWRNER